MVISHYQLQKCKENLLITARVAIKDGSAKSYTRHFVSLPTQSAHISHSVGVDDSFCQCTHRIIIQKILELVSSGIIETREVQRVLENYVKHNLQGEHGISPHSSDRAFHPLPVNIKNHVDNAKQALELSKLDQENLHLKIQGWRKLPDSLHHLGHMSSLNKLMMTNLKAHKFRILLIPVPVQKKLSVVVKDIHKLSYEYIRNIGKRSCLSNMEIL